MTDSIELEAGLSAYLNAVPKTYSLGALVVVVVFAVYRVSLRGEETEIFYSAN
jgi:hypothetical protein